MVVFAFCVVGAQVVLAQGRTVAEQYLFAALNQERAAVGLPALTWNPQMAVAAREHAIRMARMGGISHQFAGEPDLTQRTSTAGAKFSTVAENVAVGESPLTIHNAWMHSPGHRANILDAVVTSVGISAILYQGRLWAVQDFSRDVATLSLAAQEEKVRALVAQSSRMTSITPTPEARDTCAREKGYAGDRQPSFVMRYSGSSLALLPEQLTAKLASGQYTHAEVGACVPEGSAFAGYSIAVLLYP
ncbi:SCP-like extracellular [Terriglobus saanensis SP1PR4]|uniref:SCP-like extracellular n=1 Tax=Terriglobus saanensis (strain ATCC BAA-1853 / DSM 23119 / SP1PR4) TaxID=401053 RepID=E8UYD2_TERSS|nr:SCP-like extracellular [Terriglobus saanensis SP1PR4]